MSTSTKVSEAFPLSDIDVTTKARVLLEALPYIQQFRGSIFVVKYGGSFMDDPNPVYRQRVITDIVFLAAVGIHVVVVHGGGKAITRAMEASGLEATFIHGLRVTTPEVVQLVEKTLNGEINLDICHLLQEAKGRPISIPGQQILRCVRKDISLHGETIDLGRVGQIRNVEVDSINKHLASHYTPVISPIAAGADGALYNTNADEAAAQVAIALDARRLVYLCDVPGLMRDPEDESSLISTVAVDDVEQLKNEHVIAKGMLPKVESGVEALHRGVHRVHFVDGRLPHSLLLEIFTDKGIGTEIVHSRR